MLRFALLAALMGLTLIPLPAADPPKPVPSRKAVVLSAEALKIHAEAPVFDGHNDQNWAPTPPFFSRGRSVWSVG